ncbi:cytochrome-c peroxidase [Ruegeria sp. R13_0]|uniref:cytochrome c peroxidase n=1 Tax=Ruegeria sp. R13_0 TaxID=2821099 RepID=UPI001ADD333C|nr:cytochrome-c peroxidase [Ruegeria sp. R13_0]
MINRPQSLLVFATLAGGLFIAFLASASSEETQTAIFLPSPLTDQDFLYDGAPEQSLVELGRNLFFDPILSGNRNISCGTCHDPAFGSGDGLALGIGEGGSGAGPQRVTVGPVTGRVPRNAQPLWNIGARSYVSLFHDGRVEALNPADPTGTIRNPAGTDLLNDLSGPLAAQAFFPVTSPIEMAGQYGENLIADAAHHEDRRQIWENLAQRVAGVAEYLEMIRAAFPEITGAEDVDYSHIAEALAAFQTTAFRSDESPFDAVLRSRNLSLISPDAQAGLRLFYGAAGCANCHSGPLLTDHRFHAIAVPQIGPGKGHGGDMTYLRKTGLPGRTEDEGRYRVTGDPADLFAFRTPSLRNVFLTGPWGHNGVFASLEDMVRHHIDPKESFADFDPMDVSLPNLDHVQRLVSRGSALEFGPLEDTRRDAFDLRDGWVMSSPALRDRIVAANSLSPIVLKDEEIGQLVAFLGSLTDPSAVNRSEMIPSDLPSGLHPQPHVQMHAIRH